MPDKTNASPRQIALGAALLLLAATATGCGMSLPTQPALDTDPTVQRSAATTSIQEPAGGSVEMDDTVVPSGGPDVTNAPPAGEEIIPTFNPPGNGVGNAWGHYKNKRNRN